MLDSETATMVLVPGKEDFLNKLRDALANTNIALLHAETHRDAINLLERLRSEISLAIIELEHSQGWDLIAALRRNSPKPVKLIATTRLYPAPILRKLIDIGVDAAVPVGLPGEEWRKTVEAVLRKNEGPSA